MTKLQKQRKMRELKQKAKLGKIVPKKKPMKKVAKKSMKLGKSVVQENKELTTKLALLKENVQLKKQLKKVEVKKSLTSKKKKSNLLSEAKQKNLKLKQEIRKFKKRGLTMRNKTVTEGVSGKGIDALYRAKDEYGVSADDLFVMLGKYIGGDEREEFLDDVNRLYELDLEDFWDISEEEGLGAETAMTELSKWLSDDDIEGAMDANELSDRFLEESTITEESKYNDFVINIDNGKLEISKEGVNGEIFTKVFTDKSDEEIEDYAKKYIDKQYLLVSEESNEYGLEAIGTPVGERDDALSLMLNNTQDDYFSIYTDDGYDTFSDKIAHISSTYDFNLDQFVDFLNDYPEDFEGTDGLGDNSVGERDDALSLMVDNTEGLYNTVYSDTPFSEKIMTIAGSYDFTYDQMINFLNDYVENIDDEELR